MNGSAEYYQAHKDDDEEWGAPERPHVSTSRRLASMISVRFSPEEAAAIRSEASALGKSVSTFVREAALSRCGRAVSPVPSTSLVVSRIRTSWTGSWDAAAVAMTAVSAGSIVTGDTAIAPVVELQSA